MKKIVLCLVLSPFLSSFASAQSAPDQPVPAQEPASDVTVIAGDDARDHDRNCLRETGSHIVKKDEKACVDSANGQSYTREDLDRTGTNDVADALRHLDPSVTVRHN